MSDRRHRGAAGRPHDDGERQRLHSRVCGAAKEALRSFAAHHGVSEAGFVDAMVHALSTSEETWLESVVAHARAIDARRRCRDRRPQAGGSPPA